MRITHCIWSDFEFILMIILSSFVTYVLNDTKYGNMSSRNINVIQICKNKSYLPCLWKTNKKCWSSFETYVLNLYINDTDI